jgi:hypothetical protein
VAANLAWVGSGSFAVILWCYVAYATSQSSPAINAAFQQAIAGRSLFEGPPLPACTSKEVTSIVEQLIRGPQMALAATSIDGYQEISFDPSAQRRIGRCRVHTDEETILVDFVVEWLDRRRAQFAVRVQIVEVPPCDSPQVISVVQEVIRSSPWGSKAEAIEGFSELSFDRAAQRRIGQCTARIEGELHKLTYLVEWQDRGQGRFGVRIGRHNEFAEPQ